MQGQSDSENIVLSVILFINEDYCNSKMSNKLMPPLEEEIVKWALKRDFIVLPRVWRAQLVQEESIDREVNPIDKCSDEGEKSLRRVMDGFRDKWGEARVYQRTIYFPCGFLYFHIIVPDFVQVREEIHSDDTLHKFLEVNGQYWAYLNFRLGNILPDWKLDKCTLERRKKNSVLEGYFIHWYPDANHFPKNYGSNCFGVSLGYDHDQAEKMANNPIVRAISLVYEFSHGIGSGSIPVLNTTSTKVQPHHVLGFIDAFHECSFDFGKLFGEEREEMRFKWGRDWKEASDIWKS